MSQLTLLSPGLLTCKTGTIVPGFAGVWSGLEKGYMKSLLVPSIVTNKGVLACFFKHFLFLFFCK